MRSGPSPSACCSRAGCPVGSSSSPCCAWAGTARPIYEFGQHTLFGRAAGLSDEEIYSVTRPVVQHDWAPEERGVLQVVDDLYADDCVGDATWDEAPQHFTEPR